VGLRRSIAIALLLSLLAAPGQAQERKPPYWASIASGDALMRIGPGRNYPAIWRYRRADLPIRVIETYPQWRKVEDPDGGTGWMLISLLSNRRTGLVTGSEPRPLHEKPDPASRIRYFAEAGVVGRLSECSADWCRIEVKGRRGYIRTSHIWGTDPGESF
jgi:SH3-like domain-containing protein